MNTNMIGVYHGCVMGDEMEEDECKKIFFKQFLESNFELIKNRPLLLPGQTMYENSIEEANVEIGRYEESQGNDIGLPTLEENDDDLKSIFNKIRDKKLTKINKQLRTKKQEKTKYTKTKIKKEITKSKTKITKSKKRTKKGGKKRTTKKNKKRTTKKSKKRTTKKRK